MPTLILSTGISVWAVRDLLGLPTLPRCWTVSASNDSPSVQLYCAEIAAGRRTTEDWRQAIRLANAVPHENSLRTKSDRLIKQWTEEILRLGEAEFQQGDLKKALEMADKIPLTMSNRSLVNDRTGQWQSTWDKAEAIYEEVEQEIDQKNWYDALIEAKQLLTLGNRFWETTKYQELMQVLQNTREADAMYAERKAKQQTRNASNRRDPVTDRLSRWQDEQRQEATEHLQKAKTLAQSGDMQGLRAAIDEAEQVFYGTPSYEEAQAAIDNWRNQIEILEDRPYLDRAVTLANQDDIESLRAAIDEASQISWGRSLYEEAHSQIEQWRDRVSELQVQQQTEQLESLPPEERPIEPSPLDSTAVPMPEAIETLEENPEPSASPTRSP